MLASTRPWRPLRGRVEAQVEGGRYLPDWTPGRALSAAARRRAIVEGAPAFTLGSARVALGQLGGRGPAIGSNLAKNLGAQAVMQLTSTLISLGFSTCVEVHMYP